MARANIWWDSGIGYYRMTTPYSDKFRDAFKQMVPGSDREFDFDSKQWLISERVVEPVKQLVMKIWPDLSFVSREATEARERTTITSKKDTIDVIIVQFVKLCPPDALSAAYRKAAQAYHPDRAGGDSDKMTKLNMLWSRIKDELVDKPTS